MAHAVKFELKLNLVNTFVEIPNAIKISSFGVDKTYEQWQRAFI
jgi:hypothetical protein